MLDIMTPTQKYMVKTNEFVYLFSMHVGLNTHKWHMQYSHDSHVNASTLLSRHPLHTQTISLPLHMHACGLTLGPQMDLVLKLSSW